jgi:hypothetical protein
MTSFYNTFPIMKSIIRWILDTTDATKTLNYLYTNSQKIFQDVILNNLLTQDMIKILRVYSSEWSKTIDSLMIELQQRIQFYIRTEPKLRNTYDPITAIDYKIRRNLFESQGKFQQKDFDFEIDYTKPKKTIERLFMWVKDENIPPYDAVFIIIFVCTYMVLDDILTNNYQTEALHVFWKDLVLTQRRRWRESVYKKESWVNHPLDEQEDNEILLSQGTIVVNDEQRIRDQELANEQTNRNIIRSRLVLANIKLCMDDTDSVIKIMEYIAKNYHAMFARNFNSAWNDTISKIDNIELRYQRIINELVDLGLLDLVTKIMKRRTRLETAIADKKTELDDKTSVLFERYKTD